MNRENLNSAISEICDDENIGFEVMDTGKCIAYIGWFWRRVNFDSETYDFGVIPTGMEEMCSKPTSQPMVGFMENNKWGYPYVHADADEWSNIKSLLIEAVQKKTEEALKATNDAIQALSSKPLVELDY